MLGEQSVMMNPNDPFNSSIIYLNNGLQQGDFLIGPKVTFTNHSARHISEYIARRDNSDEYVLLKVLHSTEDDQVSSDHNQEKVLLHNEHLILSLLQDQPGVIHHLGLFKHQNMFILALECVMSHEYDKKGLYKDYVNLQQHIIDKKRLHDQEALGIFCDVLATVRDLHQVCTCNSNNMSPTRRVLHHESSISAVLCKLQMKCICQRCSYQYCRLISTLHLLQ